MPIPVNIRATINTNTEGPPPPPPPPPPGQKYAWQNIGPRTAERLKAHMESYWPEVGKYQSYLDAIYGRNINRLEEGFLGQTLPNIREATELDRIMQDVGTGTLKVGGDDWKQRWRDALKQLRDIPKEVIKASTSDLSSLSKSTRDWLQGWLGGKNIVNSPVGEAANELRSAIEESYKLAPEIAKDIVSAGQSQALQIKEEMEKELGGESGPGKGRQFLGKVLQRPFETMFVVNNVVRGFEELFYQPYKAGRMGFDLSSPEGMMMAQMAAGISSTQSYWHGGIGLGSTIAGGLLGWLVGAPVQGAFLGGMVGDAIAGPLADWLTLDNQEKLKVLGQIYPKAHTNVAALETLQNAGYRVGARMGWGAGTSTDEVLTRSGYDSSYGLNEAEWLERILPLIAASGNRDVEGAGKLVRTGQYFQLSPEALTVAAHGSRYMQGNGIDILGQARRLVARAGFEPTAARIEEMVQNLVLAGTNASQFYTNPLDITRSSEYVNELLGRTFRGTEFANLSSAQGQAAFGVFQGIATPTNQAQQAMMFMMLRRLHPNDSYMDLMLRMKGGAANEELLSEMFKTVPRNATGRAMMESFYLSAGGTNYQAFDKVMQSWLGGKYDTARAKADMNALMKGEAENPTGKIPPGQVQQAKVFELMTQDADQLQKKMYEAAIRAERILDTTIASGDNVKVLYENLNKAIDKFSKTLDESGLTARGGGAEGSWDTSWTDRRFQGIGLPMPYGSAPISVRKGNLTVTVAVTEDSASSGAHVIKGPVKAR